MAGLATIRVNRREALIGGLCMCCLPRLAVSADVMREIASGVFVRRGVDADAAAGNAGAIANIGFVIGKDAVLVTESGGSLTDGRWLRDQIRRRTDKPIRYVILSHVHPDHSFGACAFADDRPEFIGHAKLKPALEARGAFYRKKLSEIMGAENVGPVVLPTREIGPEGGEIDLGDRTLTFRAHGTAHTDCDLSMMDRSAGLLFTADLLFAKRVPSLDGSLLGWLKELDALEALGAGTIVPGHGPVTVGGAAFGDLRRYLLALRDETRTAIKSGKTIDQAIGTVAISEKDNWALFGDYNGRNVTQAYKELEWE
jgi:quinoprotein relay system zinc metallohydrolase 2